MPVYAYMRGRARNLSFLNLIECISGVSAPVFVVVERMLPRVLRCFPVFLFVVRVVPAAPHAVLDVVVDDEVGFLVSEAVVLRENAVNLVDDRLR